MRTGRRLGAFSISMRKPFFIKAAMRWVRPGGYRADLLHILPKHSVDAEIGVLRGDFSASVLRVVQPARYHLIDPWEFSATSKYGGAYDGVIGRFERQIACGQVVVHRTTSVNMQLPDNSLDWVYIDGAHDFEGVLNDLRHFCSMVKPAGLIAGDDYGTYDPRWGNGVEKAVNAFIKEAPVGVVSVYNHQFVLQKPPHFAELSITF
jgi:hypothetical protein